MSRKRKDETEKEEVYLGLRLTGAEAIRYQRVLKAGMARNRYAKKSDIIRELLGLAPLEALTEDDVIYFRTGKKKK